MVISNIPNAINVFAKANNLAASTVSFDIFSVNTMLRQIGAMVQVNLEEIHNYIGEKSSLMQSYEIEFRENNEPSFDLAYELSITNQKSMVTMKILPSSHIPKSETIAQELFAFIQKEKIKNNILIKIFEDELQENIEQLLEAIDEDGTLLEEYKHTGYVLEVAKSTSFIASQKGYIKFPYLADKKYREVCRNYLYVKEGALIIDVFLGDEGKKGFNCLGEIRYPSAIGKINTSKISGGENLRKEEDTHHIRYVAKINGVAHCKKLSFNVSREFTFVELTFKQCLNFIAPLDDEGITIMARANNKSNDAISSSVNIQVGSITVTGGIGSSVKIKANSVHINGTTHKNSFLDAKKVFVYYARGNIKGGEVDIIDLEGGRVFATKATAYRTTGGEVRAEYITLNRVESNGRFYADKEIEIKEIVGKNNVFVFTPLASLKKKEAIAQAQSAKQDFRAKNLPSVDELRKKYNFYVKKIGAIKQFASTLSKTNPAYKKQIEEYKKYAQEATTIKGHYADYTTYNQGVEALEHYDKSLYESRLICQTPWSNGNLVSFRYVSSVDETNYFPTGIARVIKLVEQDTTGIVIVSNEVEAYTKDAEPNSNQS